MKALKQYWFLLVPLAGLAVWLITINTRIFDSAEQKVEVVKYVEDSPSPEQRQRAILIDSINDAHAIQTRQKRYEDGVRNDSIRALKDSLIFDIIQRNADQFYQMKQSIDSIKAHH